MSDYQLIGSHKDLWPPNCLVEVVDRNGRTANAIPTWYNFTMVEGKFKYTEPYWDGCWLIECNGLTHPDIGEIIGWRNI